MKFQCGYRLIKVIKILGNIQIILSNKIQKFKKEYSKNNFKVVFQDTWLPRQRLLSLSAIECKVYSKQVNRNSVNLMASQLR